MNDVLMHAIRDRYHCDLPNSYCRVQAGGHFATTPWPNYLELNDCEWLSLEQIAAYKFLDFQITADGGFVPFALSARGDEYCFRLDWAADGAESPVVICERGESGVGYAPDFRGFLYRKALEEFGGQGGPENERGLIRLRHAVEIVLKYLPTRWSDRLNDLARVEFGEWQTGKYGSKCLLSQNELAALIESELAFPHLNEVFVQDRELLRRRKS